MVGVDKPGMERYACFTGLWGLLFDPGRLRAGSERQQDAEMAGSSSELSKIVTECLDEWTEEEVDMSLHVDRRGVGGSSGTDCRTFRP